MGDTGNDLLRYGSKIYVVMNVSSTIEVLDATTGNHLHQLSMVTSTHAKQPRKIVGYGANVFVSCFDGYVDVIDTSGFKVIKRIKVEKILMRCIVLEINCMFLIQADLISQNTIQHFL